MKIECFTELVVYCLQVLHFIFRKITDFVPCLQENEADYETLLHCPEGQDTVSAVMSRFGYLMTWEEVFNFTIDFTDTVNHIVCTRSDGKVTLN